MDLITLFQYALLPLGCVLTIKILAKLKVPTPGLLGSILFFAFMNMNKWIPPIPSYYIGILGQFILGINLATRFTRRSLLYFKEVPIPLLIATSLTFIIAIASGFLLYPYSGSDLATVIIGTAPGGFAEMVALGQSLNADTVFISFAQIMRLIAVLVLVPLFIKFLPPNKDNSQSIQDLKVQENPPISRVELFLLICANLALAYLFLKLHIPAAIILGALLGSAVYLLVKNKSLTLSIKTQYFAHSSIGLTTATRFTPEALFAFSDVILPFFIILFVSIVLNFLQGLLLAFITKWDRVTCCLASMSGGLSQMALTAQEMNANVPLVIFFHLVRLVSLIIFWPFLLKILN